MWSQPVETALLLTPGQTNYGALYILVHLNTLFTARLYIRHTRVV